MRATDTTDMTDHEGDADVFWSILANLEALSLVAEQQANSRSRTIRAKGQAGRIELDRIRERLLFDLGIAATSTAVAAVRRLVGGGRSS